MSMRLHGARHEVGCCCSAMRVGWRRRVALCNSGKWAASSGSGRLVQRAPQEARPAAGAGPKTTGGHLAGRVQEVLVRKLGLVAGGEDGYALGVKALHLAGEGSMEMYTVRGGTRWGEQGDACRRGARARRAAGRTGGHGGGAANSVAGRPNASGQAQQRCRQLWPAASATHSQPLPLRLPAAHQLLAALLQLLHLLCTCKAFQHQEACGA